MNIDLKTFVDHVAMRVRSITDPIERRVEALEAREPQHGEKGEKGDPGQDAVVEIETVVEALNADADFKHLVAENVAKQYADNPPAAGEKGVPGADGVGMAGAVIDKDGKLTLTMTDGTNRELGVVVGKDGVDGIGFEEMTPHYDKENDEIVWQYKSGNITKEVRQPACTPRHAGFWQPGMRNKCGHFVTHNGNLWYANVATEDEPSLKSDDWQLSARKGADK